MDTHRPDPINRLVDELKRLPGIGPKSAQRLVFHLIRQPDSECNRLAQAIGELKRSLVFCAVCNHIGGTDPCSICKQVNRDRETICVVEEPFNVLSIEKTGQYRGLYHVLHGAISPINGIGPEDLKLRNLFERFRDGEVKEVIVATNPTTEGEATALYLSKLIKPLEIRVSRIALGIPIGSDLEYTDQLTLTRALSGRQDL
ncbi:MAG: recombination mediator RecR [Acidobacteriota bacterium]|nr:recombination mediator RecR [Acidobacteriota bacterium]